MPRRVRLRFVLLALAGLLVVSACRVDATVELEMGPDGTGSVTVTAVADADVVARAPELADDLRFDDAITAGWTVEGPTATDDGGLRVELAHPVTSAAEATNLLGSLGPPFTAMAVERVTSEDGGTTTMTLTGELTLTGGFDAFADSDLLAAVGGSPFADDLAASGASPASSMGVALHARLAGDVDESTAHAEVDGFQVWDAPLDGSTETVLLRTMQRPPGGGLWSLLATVLLVLLVAWVVAASAFVVSVMRARARRARRRRRALSHLR